MEIREITDKTILKLILEEFSDFFTPPLYESVVNLDSYSEKLAENSMNIVLSEEGKNIGFICFYANDFVSRKAFVSLICVKEEFQKRGYATLLLKKMFEYCKNKMNSVELEVYFQNEGAIEFYEKNGFQKIGKISENKNSFYMRRLL